MKMSLAKAVALAATMGAAASAQAAISLNSNGQGQVLLYPLYTVENGNDTAISVTNTTNEFKAVKVRFREALNSQDVLDFHLFLSPKDVWNGVVVATADGAKLITRDTSCTAPAIPADGAVFSSLAYTGGAVETSKRGADGGPQDLKRTRVGYAEVIELGVLDRNLPTSTQKPGAPAGTKITFGEAIKHVNGVPGNCGALIAEYTSGNWKDGSGATNPGPASAAGTGFSYGFLNEATTAAGNVAPNVGTSAYVLGGLYGVGTVTNVFAGQQIGYDASALDGFIEETITTGLVGTAQGNLHNATGYSFPDLNGNRLPGAEITTPAAGISASKEALINGVTYTFGKAIDAVSAVLQRTEVNNEFSVDSIVGAGTDWVVTFPTKHHYVWDTQIDATGKRATFVTDPGTGQLVIGAPAAPGVGVVNVPAGITGQYVGGALGAPVADYPVANAGQANVSPFALSSLWKGVNGAASANVEIGLSYTDREERTEAPAPGTIDFSPRPAGVAPGKEFLRYEANVITFNNSNVLVAADTYARNNINLKAAYKSGWATIDLTKAAQNVTAASAVPALGAVLTFPGLPALGFATIKVSNGDLDGVLSNYNAAWNHKSK